MDTDVVTQGDQALDSAPSGLKQNHVNAFSNNSSDTF